MPNLIKPINNDQIGVWKKNLNQKDINKFNEIAGEYLRKFMYKV